LPKRRLTPSITRKLIVTLDRAERQPFDEIALGIEREQQGRQHREHHRRGDLPYWMPDAVTKASAPTVTGWMLDDPRISAKMKLFQAKMKASRAAAAMPGRASGGWRS